MTHRRSAATLAALLGLALAACGGGPPPMPRVGEQAPDFTLTSNEGRAVSLSDFRGEWVVLYFYPKDFSTGCTIQARMFQEDYEKFRTRNARIVGVSMDSAESHADFCDANSLDFTLLADTDGKVSTRYGSIRGAGDRRFSVRNTFVIAPDGSLIRVYEDVQPLSHSDRVLADLARFQGDDPPERNRLRQGFRIAPR